MGFHFRVCVFCYEGACWQGVGSVGDLGVYCFCPSALGFIMRITKQSQPYIKAPNILVRFVSFVAPFATFRMELRSHLALGEGRPGEGFQFNPETLPRAIKGPCTQNLKRPPAAKTCVFWWTGIRKSGQFHGSISSWSTARIRGCFTCWQRLHPQLGAHNSEEAPFIFLCYP